LIDTHLHVMDGNPLTAPGGPGIAPGTTGAAGANTFGLQYRELIALVNAQRDLSAGFTTVVDLMTHGGWYGTVDLRNAIDNGLVQGPRMQVAGPGIVATNRANLAFPLQNESPIANLGAQVANGPDGVRAAVREQAHYGVDWIKIYSTQVFRFEPNGTMVNTPTFTLDAATYDRSGRLHSDGFALDPSEGAVRKRSDASAYRVLTRRAATGL